MKQFFEMQIPYTLQGVDEIKIGDLTAKKIRNHLGQEKWYVCGCDLYEIEFQPTKNRK